MTIPAGFQRGDRVTGRAFREALLWAGKRPTGGNQIEVRGDGDVINYMGQVPARQVTFPAIFLTQNVVIANAQWTYDIAEVFKKFAGYSAPGNLKWAVKDGGRTGTAYNYAEDFNDGLALEGHGINVDNLPGSYATQPVPLGLVWPVTEVRYQVFDEDVDGMADRREFWFSYVNGIDGEC
jgi:hypothetical protein